MPSFKIEGAPSDSLIVAQVASTRGNKTSPYSSGVSAKSGDIPVETPSIPDGIDLSVNGQKILIRISDTRNAVQYLLQYKRTSSVGWSEVLLDELEWTTPVLLPAESYDFQVKAINFVGESDFSEIEQATTGELSNIAPQRNADFRVNSRRNRFQVRLTYWGTNAADRFRVRYRNLSLGENWREVEQTNLDQFWFIIRHTSNAEEWEFQVKNGNSVGFNSRWSSSVYATSIYNEIPSPPVPHKLTISDLEIDGATITSPNTDTNYITLVRFKELSVDNWVEREIRALEQTTTLHALMSSSTYMLQSKLVVDAFMDTRDSDWSDIQFFITQPVAGDVPEIPSGLIAQETGSQTVFLWNLVSGATGYDIEYTIRGVSTIVEVNEPFIRTTTADIFSRNLTARIRAKNGLATSEWSSRVGITFLTPQNTWDWAESSNENGDLLAHRLLYGGNTFESAYINHGFIGPNNRNTAAWLEGVTTPQFRFQIYNTSNNDALSARGIPSVAFNDFATDLESYSGHGSHTPKTNAKWGIVTLNRNSLNGAIFAKIKFRIDQATFSRTSSDITWLYDISEVEVYQPVSLPDESFIGKRMTFRTYLYEPQIFNEQIQNLRYRNGYVTWDEIESAEYYQLEYLFRDSEWNRGRTENWTSRQRTTETFFDWPPSALSVPPIGTDLVGRVRASNGEDFGPWRILFFTEATTSRPALPPTIPAIDSIDNPSHQEMYFQWIDPTGLNDFVVEGYDARWRISNQRWNEIGIITEKEYRLKGLQELRSFDFAVRIVAKKDNIRVYSGYRTVRDNTSREIRDIGSFAVDSIGNTHLDVSAVLPERANAFRVRYRKGSEQWVTQVFQTTSGRISPLARGFRYELQAQAIELSGTTERSVSNYSESVFSTTSASASLTQFGETGNYDRWINNNAIEGPGDYVFRDTKSGSAIDPRTDTTSFWVILHQSDGDSNEWELDQIMTWPSTYFLKWEIGTNQYVRYRVSNRDLSFGNYIAFQITYQGSEGNLPTKGSLVDAYWRLEQ